MKFKDLRWLLIVSFFILSIVNVWFGLFGFICMGSPIVLSLLGHGKKHCQSHCPRGSFLGKVVSLLSLRNSIPKFMLTHKFRNGVLTLMIVMLTISMIHTGGEPKKIAFSLFRLMGISFIVGIIMGIFFKPKSWCTICPMGHSAALITSAQKNSNSDKIFTPKRKKSA